MSRILSRTCSLPCTLAVASLLAAGCSTTKDEHDPEVAQLRQGVQICPGAVTVPGIDVSEWQGAIDWNAVAAGGFKYAITRINDGHHMDPTFQGNWAAIKQVGLIRGAYQFYEPTIDPTTQANWVINAVGRLGPGDLPVTLDVEWTTGTPNAGDIYSWVLQVAAGTGKVPMIYTAVGYWNQYFNTQFGNLDLWVANYGVNCPNIPSSWDHWLFWQWGGGPVPGIGGNVDQNVFNGSLQDLQIAAGQSENSGCTAGLQVACAHFGCGCAEGTCSGGYCPGTGCSQAQRDACGAFGCNCVDQQCNGGFCPGTGCTAKETNDCAAFAVGCVDHQCAGGFGPGSGCTAREMLDCGHFGCGCVDHHCAGGFCPGADCTAREQLDCTAQGQGCMGHRCVPTPDAGTPAPVDAGSPGSMPVDAGQVVPPVMPGADAGVVLPPAIDAGPPVVPPMISTDGGEIPRVTPDAGPMGVQPPPAAMPGADAGPSAPPEMEEPVSGGCSTTFAAPLLWALAALLRRRAR